MARRRRGGDEGEGSDPFATEEGETETEKVDLTESLTDEYSGSFHRKAEPEKAASYQAKVDEVPDPFGHQVHATNEKYYWEGTKNEFNDQFEAAEESSNE